MKFKDLKVGQKFKSYGYDGTPCICVKTKKSLYPKKDNVRVVKGIMKFASFDVKSYTCRPNREIKEKDLVD